MNFKELLTKEETQEEYLSRTYWNNCNYPNKPFVMVWESKSQLQNPASKPKKISMEEARRYIQKLEPIEDAKPNKTYINVEPAKAELVEVSYEDIGNEQPTKQEWIDSMTGEVKHSIRR